MLAVFLLGCSCLASVQARVLSQSGELKILAIGDSITQGSVPSKGANHPYTIQLKNLLQSKYPGMNIAIDNQGMGCVRQVTAQAALRRRTAQQACMHTAWGSIPSDSSCCSKAGLQPSDRCKQGHLCSAASRAFPTCCCCRCRCMCARSATAGVGGSGIFAVGFNRPTTIVPVAMDSLNSAKSSGRMYDYTIVMVGINDLLRVGKSADEVMSGLNQIYDAALSSGSNVIAIPPFAAPGFVSQ